MRYLKIFLPIFILLATIPAKAVLLMPWERLPLAVPLIVGQERVIFVDRNVRVGLPESLTTKLRVQTFSGTVYLLAREEIAPTRLQLQDAQTGELILIDIVTIPATKELELLEPIRIVEGENPAWRYGTSAAVAEIAQTPSDTAIPRRETPVPVVLTRYAAQSLYAPLRTVEPVSGITRVNLRAHLDLTTLLPTLPVTATPMAAWRIENYWVTAIKLQNRTQATLTLDPRLLQGDFVAATFQHTWLGPAGSSTDTTVVYLVTQKHDLAGSLLPAISPVDASHNISTGGAHEK